MHQQAGRHAVAALARCPAAGEPTRTAAKVEAGQGVDVDREQVLAGDEALGVQLHRAGTRAGRGSSEWSAQLASAARHRGTQKMPQPQLVLKTSVRAGRQGAARTGLIML